MTEVPPRSARTARTVLVVGSYPPVGTPGAAVALATVRRLLADGARPVVASPRATAATYDLPVVGPIAGRRLDQLRRATGADELIFVVERDFPVPTSAKIPASLPALQRLTTDGIVRVLAGFGSSSFVVVGDAGVPASTLDRLRTAGATVTFEEGGPTTPGVTVLGPDHVNIEAMARRAGGNLARKALGRREPAARRLAGQVRRAAHLAGRR